MKTHPATLTVTDTRIASCLLALGFPGCVNPTVIESTRETRVEVIFKPASVRFPELNPHRVVAHWREGMLQKAEPMHAFCCMMRAQASYDAFLKLQREGGMIRLEVDHPEKPLHYRYVPGPHGLDRLYTHEEPLTSLDMAAALGPLGIGLVGLQGSTGQHRYLMAAVGRPVMLSDGAMHRHVTADLVRRAADGAWAIVAEQPMHPLTSGLEALHARAVLKKEIQGAQARAGLLITADDGTAKQALLSLSPSGRVVRTVERHLGAAPGSLDI